MIDFSLPIQLLTLFRGWSEILIFETIAPLLLLRILFMNQTGIVSYVEVRLHH